MGIGEFPQQAENRIRVTKALLAEEWILSLIHIKTKSGNGENEDGKKTV